MRRTKATVIYRRTRNLRAVQLLLGHTKIESTVRYLGVEVDDALEIAEQTDVCPEPDGQPELTTHSRRTRPAGADVRWRRQATAAFARPGTSAVLRYYKFQSQVRRQAAQEMCGEVR